MKRFCGYVLANDAEEYLAAYELFGDSASLVWAKVPDLAQCFPSRKSAETVIREIDVSYPVYVLVMYESPSQYLVLTDLDQRPVWLD